MRANIKNGVITSIGTGKELPYQIPEEINYSNFTSFVCVDTSNPVSMSSWVDKAYFADMKEKENTNKTEENEKTEEQDFFVEPETEEVKIVPHKNRFLNIFVCLFSGVFCAIYTIDILKNDSCFDAINIILFYISCLVFGFTLNPIIKNISSWK